MEVQSRIAKQKKNDSKSSSSSTTSGKASQNNSKNGSFLSFNRSLFFSLMIVIIGFAITFWQKDDGGNVSLEKSAAPITKDEIRLLPKYESDIVALSEQVNLKDHDECSSNPSSFEVLSDRINVMEAMNKTDELRKEGKVFIMLNGENEGIFFSWSATNGKSCLYSLAETAAVVLGADVKWINNGLRLFTQMGYPIETADDLDVHASRIAHVMLDGQLWVWPGIHVGYVYRTNDVEMTTMSLKPKVFNVKHFFTEEEAEQIIKEGREKMERSPVDSYGLSNGISEDRTSYTAFLPDGQLTRSFRRRSASLARLPSPCFAERLQLVRYENGQFFRKHEDYFSSKKFLDVSQNVQYFDEWIQWASNEIRNLGDRVPPLWKEGGDLFPTTNLSAVFELKLLEGFLAYTNNTEYWDTGDAEWRDWIQDNVKNGAMGITKVLLKSKPYMLPTIIRSWESNVNMKELQYTIPTPPTSGVTQYFRWIRYVKQKISDLKVQIPQECQPSGRYYPKYVRAFQNVLIHMVLDTYPEEELKHLHSSPESWLDWIRENVDKPNDPLLDILKDTPQFLSYAIQAWTNVCSNVFEYEMPNYVKHFEPQRFVTLFLYLNTVEGGETVFPFSKERLVTGIVRNNMSECSLGLAVPAIKTEASLFYSQTPSNDVDPSSLHGGCPPVQGTKWGANSFMWNADAEEGANAWDL